MGRIYISSEWRRLIIARANHLCEYCKIPAAYAVQSFVIEHIIPLSKNGETILENLAYACGGCNGYKYNKINAVDPADGEVVPLFNPRQEEWQKHFVWNENYTLVIGTTSTGRATVEALQLNRNGLINLRKLLFLTGKYPLL